MDLDTTIKIQDKEGNNKYWIFINNSKDQNYTEVDDVEGNSE